MNLTLTLQRLRATSSDAEGIIASQQVGEDYSVSRLIVDDKNLAFVSRCRVHGFSYGIIFAGASNRISQSYAILNYNLFRF